MDERRKTKAQLLAELAELRQHVARDAIERERAETARRESEQRFRSMLEEGTDSYWECDLLADTVQIGPRLYEMLGYEPGDIEPSIEAWQQLIHPDDLLATIQAYSAHFEGHTRYYEVEHRLMTRSGQWKWMLNRGRNVKWSADGSPQRLVGSYTDISARKRAEAELQQRNRELWLLNRSVQALTSTLDLNEVLALVLEELRHILAVSASSIWLIDPGTRELVCRQAIGSKGDIVRGWRVPYGAGFVGWVAQHEQSLIVPDALTDSRHLAGVNERLGMIARSIITVPLRSRERVIGVIQALDERPGLLDADAQRLLEMLATAASIAVENARLFEETRRRADRLAVLSEISIAINQPLGLEDVLQAAVRELARGLHVEQAGLALFDEARQRLTIMADVPAPGSPWIAGTNIPIEDNVSMQRILSTKAPLAVYDAQHDPLLASVQNVLAQRRVQSILIVPLLLRGEVIGTVSCNTVDAPRHFTREDIDLTLTVANLIAVRFEQARLFEAERDQRMLAEALRDSAAALNRTLYFDEVLDRVLDNVGRVVPHDAANIMLIDDYGVAHVARGHDPAGQGGNLAALAVRLPVAMNPTLHKMFETGSPLIIPDTTVDAGWTASPETALVHSYAGAPIRAKGQVLGFLQVSSAVANYFTPAHAERLQVFADQAAIAIQNARLYDQVQHYADELEERVAERTQELSQAYEHLKVLDQAKDQFVSRVSHELRTPIANIQLYLNLLEKGRPEKYAEYMQTLHRESGRLNKMIDDLLDISHLDMGKTEFRFAPTDVNRILADLIAERKADAAGRSLSVQQHLTEPLARASADAALLTQVFSNLLSNAFNYTPSGGSITCSTALHSYADRDWVTVTIQDSGPGIQADELPHLGERFYRGRGARNYRVPGTGLGLALSKEIIDRHGGRLTIDSEPGHGATFTVWLRLA